MLFFPDFILFLNSHSLFFITPYRISFLSPGKPGCSLKCAYLLF